ncbi:hypothetical protein ACF3M1_03805 [Luteimonas sp. WGS1318]|uniref:hypothetical protein n=1 Tax=Luteimonas sp. WGS1318 TaxID=3366815 RepID=UPI00372D0BF6
MSTIKETSMQMGRSALLLIVALASASGHAYAGSVRGPVGVLELPGEIVASVAPSNLAHPNIEVSAVITLVNAQSEILDQTSVQMSCVPAIGQLGSEKGIERLAAITLQMDGSLKLDKTGEWIEFDSIRAYRTDASRAQNSHLTQWMIPRGDRVAWIKFDRPRESPMEQAVLSAIGAMQITCGAVDSDGDG